MAETSLLSVEAARASILANAPASPAVAFVRLADALGRTSAKDLAAELTQPPMAVSAMDGYALRAADLASLPVTLTIIGESAAGHGFAGSLGPLGNRGAGEDPHAVSGAERARPPRHGPSRQRRPHGFLARVALTKTTTGLPVATPFAAQDSSLLRVLAQAHCLVIREARAPAAKAGDPCRILRLPGRA